MRTTTTLSWQRLNARVLVDDAALRADWNRLNDCRLGVPILHADAVAAALTVFGDGREQLFVGRLGTDVAAMFVLQPQGRLRWSTFQPSQLPLGCWVATAEFALDDLARQMMRSGAAGLCLAISVTQVDPLQAERGGDAADNRHIDYIPTSWLEVSGSFEEYWAARGKNLRQNARKQRNKLATDGIAARMRLMRDVAEVAPALARYGTMEGAGWKAQQGTAILPDNDQGRFYDRLLRDAAARGEALITEYLFDDCTVAMNFGLLRAGIWIVLKTTYDETVPNALSPASLLREDELQHIFGGGEIRRIEYYGRTMDWHTKLTDRQRTLYHLTAYRWPWVKRLVERRRRPTAAVQPSAEAPAKAE
jgi:CelD/BcsL family acetyltransferase involved in cellulose biosynthesis